MKYISPHHDFYLTIFITKKINKMRDKLNNIENMLFFKYIWIIKYKFYCNNSSFFQMWKEKWKPIYVGWAKKLLLGNFS